jgi:hypothetical protein
MKTVRNPFKGNTTILTLLLLIFSTALFAQSDDIQQKKERKAKSSFKLSAGATFNDIKLDSDSDVEANSALGYNLGISYKRGRFFYYEIGARINSRSFDLKDLGDQSVNSITISAVDVPLSGGVNLTSFADRLVGLRVFVSAVPSFTVGKKVEDIGLVEDDIQNVMFYGQAGVGIDIAFFFIESGFNFGVDDLVKNIENESIKSVPSQVFVNLGFRF